MYTIQEIKDMPIEERLKVLDMRAKLQKKKAEVVGLVKRIPKNGYNKFHQYEYSTESDIKEGVRSLLSEAGLTLDIELINDSKIEVNTKQGKAWLHTVQMEFILTDNDTGFMDIKTSKGEATDNGDKGIYKAYAGCIKYYLINNFLISTGEKNIDPEDGESEQVFNNKNNNYNNKNNNKGNKGGNNGNNNNRNNNNGGGSSPAPKATRSGVEAKWKQLNNGSLEGLDEYLAKKQGDLDTVDKVLLGKMQAKQAEAKKAKEQADKPEDFNKAMEELKPITDVSTGKAVEYNGKEIVLD